MNRRQIVTAGSALLLAGLGQTVAGQALAEEAVEVDLRSDAGALAHIWSECVGSDRAGITLRESWRRDAARGRKELGVKRVRFHGVFDDETGAAPKRSLGATGYNFQNIDEIYDGLLDLGLQPFVELSFMPGKLASGTQTFGTYRGNVTPPTSLAEWQDFIQQFVRHLLGRYGQQEVRQWYFEVWNEPDLGFFWSGSQADYFNLYKATAEAVKAVEPALKVGGPSTSKIQWFPEFLSFCAQNQAPVDFLSTHCYAGDNQEKLFGQAGLYASQNDVVPAAMARARQQIDASPFKGTPLWLGEWSSDSPAMIAHIIKGCLPYVAGMSYWQISKFEEILIPNYVLKEGDNGWGLMSPRNIARPSFNTLKLMNALGDRRLEASGPALASKGPRGAACLVWNLAEVPQPAGIPGASRDRTVIGRAKRLRVAFRGAGAGQRVKISFVDMQRGSPYPAWRALGSPQYPSREDLARIRASAELAPPTLARLGAQAELIVDLPPEGVALIELV